MKRVTSMILVVLLFLLPVGCTVEDDGGASTTTTGTPTTTTNQVANQGKVVEADYEHSGREDLVVDPGEIYYSVVLEQAINDPANEGAQFAVKVQIDVLIYELDMDKFEELKNELLSIGVPFRPKITSAEVFFYTQGTKEQIEAIPQLEPSWGYYVWLTPSQFD